MTVIAPLHSRLLDEQQRQTERLSAAVGVYQKTDRILTGETALTVRVEQSPACPAVAWTDGSQITFNATEIDAADVDSVERMNGINFHELAHVLYTPRRGTRLVSWVLDNRCATEFNILEDQRIETLLTARLPSTVPWLQAAIARWVLKSDTGPTGYLFVRGRRYLDGRLRGALRASFIRQDLLPEIDSIVDEYRLLTFGADYERAKGLIARFAVVMREVRDTPGFPNGAGDAGVSDPNSHEHRPEPVLSSGRPKGIGEQTEDAKRAARSESDPEQVPSTPSSGPSGGSGHDDADEPESPGSSSGGDDDSTDAVEDSGYAGSADAPSAKGGQSTDTTQVDRDTTHGTGAGLNEGAEDVLRQIAQTVLDEIRNDVEVRTEIRRTQQQIAAAGGSDILKQTQYELRQPTGIYPTLFASLRKSLSRLLTKADPGWESRTSSGKVNPGRWMRERDIETAFDMWDDGVNDAVDMEVVILLDESGSMGTRMVEAANAMWVIKRALDRINASTTVITFDNQSRVLYHRREKATGEVRYSYHGGGTDPVDGLSQAGRIFARTNHSQRILVLLTDGEFADHRTDDDGVSADEWIERMGRNGVTTAFGFIGNPGWTRKVGDHDRAHGCQLAAAVNGASLVDFVSQIVTTAIRQRLVGR